MSAFGRFVKFKWPIFYGNCTGLELICNIFCHFIKLVLFAPKILVPPPSFFDWQEIFCELGLHVRQLKRHAAKLPRKICMLGLQVLHEVTDAVVCTLPESHGPLLKKQCYCGDGLVLSRFPSTPAFPGTKCMLLKSTAKNRSLHRKTRHSLYYHTAVKQRRII